MLAPASVKLDLRTQLEPIGLVTHIGQDRLYATLPVALDAASRPTRESPTGEWPHSSQLLMSR